MSVRSRGKQGGRGEARQKLGLVGEDALLQLSFLLLLLAARRPRHARVGGALQDVLRVEGALAEDNPSLGVVVVRMRRVRRRSRNMVLESTEVGENVGDTGHAVDVYFFLRLPKGPGQRLGGVLMCRKTEKPAEEQGGIRGRETESNIRPSMLGNRPAGARRATEGA